MSTGTNTRTSRSARPTGRCGSSSATVPGASSGRREIQDAAAEELVALDLDGDGGTDILTFAEGTRLIRAARAGSLVSAPLEAPATLRSVRAADIDGDGRADLLGAGGDGIAFVRHLGGVQLDSPHLIDLPLAAGTPRLVFAGRLPAGLRALAVLRVAGEGEPFTAVFLDELAGLATSAGAPAPAIAADVTEPPVAPLSLRFDLR